jgi:YVTN family beta-propeller protein
VPSFRYLTLVLAGALAAPHALARGGGTALAIYVQPLPPEATAAGLAVRLGPVTAVRADGTSVELDPRIDALPAGGTQRTRLLATGDLPPGPYVGLRVRAASARLRTAGDDVPLDVAEETPLTPFEFVAAPDRPALVTLALRYRESLREEAVFAPVFAAVRSPRPSVETFGAVCVPGADLLALFDRMTGEIVDLVGTARGPVGVAIDASARRAYVACAGEESVQAIDLAEGVVIASRSLRVGDSPAAAAVTPDGRTVLVANAGSGTVALFDAPTLAERTRVKVGVRPSWLVVDRAGARAFVFDEMADVIPVLDLQSATVTAVLPTEGGPFRGALDGGGRRLYAVHRASPYLRAFDTTTLEAAGEVYVGPDAIGVTVDRRRDRIHLALGGPPRVEVFDAFSLLASDTFALPAPPSILAADDRENNLCLVVPRQGALRLVRFVGQGDVATVELPGEPGEVAFVDGR